METKKLVLICDDEEGVREALKLILEDECVLAEASSAVEVIEQSKKLRPDVIILDIKMPKMNGIDALKEIRKVSPKSKVIMASGYKSVETAQEAIKNGASDYMVKPFDSKKVLELVRTV